MVKGATYKKAGVDIDAGDRLVGRIAPLARRTFSRDVIQDIGSFGALYRIDLSRYAEPVLVSGTDGVGTKLKIAFLTNRHDTIGIDLVAMCVNDILTSGADPAYFLDYFATGKLDLGTAEDVIRGIAEGCRLAECSLVGGETAEMPGFYQAGEYDIAGFAVGIVNRSDIVDGSRVEDGDVIIGIASSGLHSNGYSLVREVLFNIGKYSADTYSEDLGKTVGEELLVPTGIYVRAVKAVREAVRIRAMAHITGGGIPGNLARQIPAGFRALVDERTWERPAIFPMIKSIGNVPEEDMKRTFNLGIGFALIVREPDADRVSGILKQLGLNCYAIGNIRTGGEGVHYV